MFKFKLQDVLKHRIIQEENRQREFSSVQQQIDALRARQRELAEGIARRGEQIRERQQVGMAFAEREIFERWIAGQQVDLRQLDGEGEKLREALEQARQRLVEAMRQRKIMEKLRERHEQEFKAAEGKAEGRMFDEIALREFSTQSR